MGVKPFPHHEGETQQSYAAHRSSCRIEAGSYSAAIRSIGMNLRLASFLVAFDQARARWEYCRESEKEASDARPETLCHQTGHNGTQATEEESHRVFMRPCLLQG